jgi:DNA-binding beta-propeller fold protein YncE
LRAGKINYQISGDIELYEWDPIIMPSTGMSMGFSQNFYELAIDNVNNYLYATSTDWFSYGMVHVYDSNNTPITLFSCGISPGTIVFDIRSTTVGITNITSENMLEGTIYDIFGRKLNSLEDQPEGIYLVDGKKVYIPKR